MAIYHSRLPKEYQEVEYIESTGTQYIDTGVAINNNVGIDISFAYSSLGDVNQILVGGLEIGIGRFMPIFYFKSDATFRSDTTINNNRQFVENANTNKHNLKYNINATQRKIVYDNSELNFLVENIGSSNNTIYIFARNYPIDLSLSKAKIYSCKLYDNNSLVRNFIPCYRKSDSVIGLYDMVNDVFYTNAGSGTFLKGNNKLAKVIDIYKGTTQIIKKYKGNSLFYHRLPSEFQQVEYIQSTGSQYIDSGIIGNQNTSYKIKCATTQIVQQGVLFGSRTRATENNISTIFPARIDGSFQNALNDFGNYNDTRLTMTNIDIGDIVVFYNSKDNRYINNITKNESVSNTASYTASFTTPNNLYIFYKSIGFAIDHYNFIGKLYSCQIYDNGTLIRNFMPCYRKSDGVIGLYDLKNDVFFTNAGTGTFLKGNNVL